MNYKGYELFYVNGSSHSAGGGLEDETLAPNDSVVPYYRKKYNIEWSVKKEVAFGHRLSESIGIPCVNEAENGGGLGRVVRMSYAFIEKNWNIKDKIFLILEKPEHAFRTDVYYKPMEKFFIVNCQIDYNRVTLTRATPNYQDNDPNINRVQSIFQEYLDRHHDYIEHGKSVERSFVGLYSFCRLHNIPIKVMNTPGEHDLETMMYKEMFDKRDIINLDFAQNSYVNSNIYYWCRLNNLSIAQEIPEYSDDFHPGYFGHKEYAERLKFWLDEFL